MNVLSLFDGMSCGRIALERVGIKVTNYFASEIDKHAIKVSKANYPDIKHVGSVDSIVISYDEALNITRIYNFITGEDFTFYGKFDLIIGGSPCQGFSFAGKQLNFSDPRSKLFFDYVYLLESIRKHNPEVKFLLENVKMKKESEDVITGYMGVEPIKLNSALVSAQTRKRLYWTNIPYFGAPLDKQIFLKDILLTAVDPKYIHSAEAVAYMCREVAGGRSHWDFHHHHDSDKDKSSCITAVISKGVPYNVLIDRHMQRGSEVYQVNQSKKANGVQPHMQDRIYDEQGKSVAVTAEYASRINVLAGRIVGRKVNPVTGRRDDNNQELKALQRLEINTDPGKTNCLTTVEKDNVVVLQVREATKAGYCEVLPGQCFDNTFSESKTRRGRLMVDKSNCLTAANFEFNHYLGDTVVRRLTPIECERLQTVPDDYTKDISDVQRYRMLGNGWTVDMIAHLFHPLTCLDLL